MVYENDFYTTRRPYTRPTISSYSVTVGFLFWREFLSKIFKERKMIGAVLKFHSMKKVQNSRL